MEQSQLKGTAITEQRANAVQLKTGNMVRPSCPALQHCPSRTSIAEKQLGVMFQRQTGHRARGTRGNAGNSVGSVHPFIRSTPHTFGTRCQFERSTCAPPPPRARPSPRGAQLLLPTSPTAGQPEATCYRLELNCLEHSERRRVARTFNVYVAPKNGPPASEQGCV
eukprot:363965-Chlamydomonas_euryale.AAC.16